MYRLSYLLPNDTTYQNYRLCIHTKRYYQEKVLQNGRDKQLRIDRGFDWNWGVCKQKIKKKLSLGPLRNSDHLTEFSGTRYASCEVLQSKRRLREIWCVHRVMACSQGKRAGLHAGCSCQEIRRRTDFSLIVDTVHVATLIEFRLCLRHVETEQV